MIVFVSKGEGRKWEIRRLSTSLNLGNIFLCTGLRWDKGDEFSCGFSELGQQTHFSGSCGCEKICVLVLHLFSIWGNVWPLLHLLCHHLTSAFVLLTSRYSPSMKSLGNKFMHLTNYSVNKKNAEYQANADEMACQGHKWY